MREFRNQISEVWGKRMGIWLPCTALSMRLIVCIAFLLVAPQLAHAAVFNCSTVSCLISSINTANTNGVADTINLAAGTYTLTAVNNNADGPSGLPSITSQITINGASRSSAGAITTTIERGGNAPSFRIFHVSATGNLSLDRLIIRNGLCDSGGGGILNDGGKLRLNNSTVADNGASGIGVGGSGGGIYNLGSLSLFNSTVSDNKAEFTGGGIFSGSGTLVLANSTVSSNEGRRNGGIHNQASMTINNSTISSNIGDLQSGGIQNVSAGTAKLRHVTVANNTLGFEGGNSGAGGIVNSGDAKISLLNTILAQNTSQGGGFPDCKGTLTSKGYNLVGDNSGCNFVSAVGDQVGTSNNPIDPMLDSLDDYSDGNGATQTHALLANSQAVDKIPQSKCPILFIDFLDQRKYVRPGSSLSAKCDIGAFERAAKPACGFSPGKGSFDFIPLAATKFGDSGNNSLTGTAGPDRIHGLGGNDTISGLEGDDKLLCGGTGADTLNGGGNSDVLGTSPLIGGEDGGDTLKGGNGDDSLSGDVGNDQLFGEGANDNLSGGRDDDTLNGGGGNDDVCNGGDHINGDTATNCETVTNVP